MVEGTDADDAYRAVLCSRPCGSRCTVYTDEARAYKGMPFKHEAVRHSAGEYVKEMAHTNGIESFWATLKRAHKGVYHKVRSTYSGMWISLPSSIIFAIEIPSTR